MRLNLSAQSHWLSTDITDTQILLYDKLLSNKHFVCLSIICVFSTRRLGTKNFWINIFLFDIIISEVFKEHWIYFYNVEKYAKHKLLYKRKASIASKKFETLWKNSRDTDRKSRRKTEFQKNIKLQKHMPCYNCNWRMHLRFLKLKTLCSEKWSCTLTASFMPNNAEPNL